MKKTNCITTLLAFLISLISLNSFAQFNFGERFLFNEESTDLRMMIRQEGYIKMVSDTNISQVYSGIVIPSPFEENRKPRSPIILGIKLNPTLTNWYSSDVKSITKSFASYIISDSTDAILVAMGITLENMHEYQYHVVENDSVELIPWSPVYPMMEQKYGAIKPYANLGTYNAPGKQILIEVVNTKDYSIRDGVIFDWRVDFTPKVSQILVNTNRNYFNLNFAKLNRGYATKFDKHSGMPIDLKFPVDSIDNFYFYFENHETVPYQITLKKENDRDTTTKQIDSWILDNRYHFDSEHFAEPGKYELTIERINVNNRVKEEQKLRFKFEVLPPPVKAKSFSLIQIIGLGGGLLILFLIIFLSYYWFNKRKLAKTKKQKELVTLKLKSIQSQLNPHFMFNALSSIQNLMNKNDVEGANHYLGKFSSLTRKVLDSGDNEMISLEDELKIIEDYLQMEQLRFGFNYQINVDKQINKTNIEVPNMLLQPFIENAVKHGVSTLNKNGLIKIDISQKNSDLTLQVNDNGAGFSIESINGNSLGIKLVKERIKLLNQSCADQIIVLKIDSNKNGTTIILELENWV